LRALENAADCGYDGFMTDQTLLNRITSNPRQCGGRACIRGMRMRVSDIPDMQAGGATRADILESYPCLEGDDISAALLLKDER
jgi:uncharacterized protein (DUF433 family)